MLLPWVSVSTVYAVADRHSVSNVTQDFRSALFILRRIDKPFVSKIGSYLAVLSAKEPNIGCSSFLNSEVRRMQKLAVIVACLVVAGCATTPVTYAEAEPVPADRILAKEMTKLQPEAARLSITRDSGMAGAACTQQLFIDGRPVALFRPGERLDVYVTPGEHVLSAKPGGICAGGTGEVGITVAAKQWKRYRMSRGQDGTIAFSATAF